MGSPPARSPLRLVQPRTARAVSLAAAARAAFLRLLRGAAEFVARVYQKAAEDDIFFLAGGIAFNVLVAAIPFMFLIVALLGFILSAVVENPQQAVLQYVLQILPASRAVIDYTSALVEGVIGSRRQFTVVGVLLFVWISTRLIGTLRTALRDIFDLQEDRGILAGKLFDAQMVVVAGTLFVANTGITIAVEAIQTYGISLLGLQPGEQLKAIQAFYAQTLAFGFIFLMFVLIYRYLPARRIPWRIALVAATFTSVSWELLKGGFAWYVSYAAERSTPYGALTTLILLVLWIYYSAVVFILGGEVAQVYEMNRIRHRQKELLE